MRGERGRRTKTDKLGSQSAPRYLRRYTPPFPMDTWYINTGASQHFMCNREFLCNFVKTNSALFMLGPPKPSMEHSRTSASKPSSVARFFSSLDSTPSLRLSSTRTAFIGLVVVGVVIGGGGGGAVMDGRRAVLLVLGSSVNSDVLLHQLLALVVFCISHSRLRF